MIQRSGEEPVVIEYLKDSAEPRAPQGIDRGDGNSRPGAPAREGHALRSARSFRSEMDGRGAPRLHGRASDPDRAPDRGCAQGREALPAARNRARHPAEAGLPFREKMTCGCSARLNRASAALVQKWAARAHPRHERELASCPLRLNEPSRGDNRPGRHANSRVGLLLLFARRARGADRARHRLAARVGGRRPLHRASSSPP